jgi:hypothetical protein
MTELESAVVEAAVKYVKGEVYVGGSLQEESDAITRYAANANALIAAVDALVAARSETKGKSQDDLILEDRERVPREDVLRWVQEEILPEIGDMGGDATRRKWWNEAANVLRRLLEVAIVHPEMTTSEELYAAQRDETPTGDMNTVQEDVL